jgi:hypothetical protein
MEVGWRLRGVLRDDKNVCDRSIAGSPQDVKPEMNAEGCPPSALRQWATE